MRSAPSRFCLALIVGLCGLLMKANADNRTTQYAVVPSSWITHDTSEDGKTAYVFPSLYGSYQAKDLEFTLPNFFRANNRFRTPDTPFRWSSWSGEDVVLTVSRIGAQSDVGISAKASSISAIRRLGWEQFQHLQKAFRHWLCRRSVSWFFDDCESKFTNLQGNLTKIWREHFLADAQFIQFADAYLNTAKPREILYDGSSGVFIHDATRMFATRVVPGQTLVVTWGNGNFYPPRAGLQGYSRITSGGQTELRVVADEGMRLYPAYACEMAAGPQNQETNANDGLLPFPPRWVSLFSREFLPVYNIFDLHNTTLLHNSPLDPPACPDGINRTPPAAPRYFFLLTPANYLKADAGTATADIARFENEARFVFLPNPSNADDRDDINMLARQFLLIGCDSPDLSTLNREWSHILEAAFAALPNASLGGPISDQACGGYVNGLFAGKSFVESRNHFSINGHPVEPEANPETLGEVLAKPPLAAHLNRVHPPDAHPLVEVVRLPDREPASGTMRIRFYTTMKQVLDQAYVLEGDEIHADSISEDLR
jgi:hypothetical protein